MDFQGSKCAIIAEFGKKKPAQTADGGLLAL